MAYKRGHMASNSRAYTRVGTHDFQVVVGANHEDSSSPPSEHDYGWKPIWLRVGRPGMKQSTWISLTSMTVEELEAMKTVINLAIDDALVIASDLDLKAIELINEGATEIPFRAFASSPPFYERPIDLKYVDQDPYQDALMKED